MKGSNTKPWDVIKEDAAYAAYHDRLSDQWSPGSRIPYRVLWLWYVLKDVWGNLMGVTYCRWFGHNTVVDEGGDAESGPDICWWCTRCHHGGRHIGPM